MKKSKNEVEDIKSYSENLVKNLISKTDEKISETEKQFEEDFYTKDIDLANKKNTYNSSVKRENIDKNKKLFFNEDFEYEEDELDEDKSKNSVFKLVSIVLIILLSFSTTFLAINLFSTKSELNKLTLQVNESLSKDNNIEQKLLEEDLNAKISILEQENKNLKQKLNDSDELTTQKQNTNTEIDSNLEDNLHQSDSSPESSEYLVQSGDNFWVISKKVYGDGSKFQQILDANNLTENSTLQIGQKLIIP